MKNEKRIPFHLTLSENTKSQFEKFCEEKSINKSRLVEWLLIQYVKNQEHNQNA